MTLRNLNLPHETDSLADAEIAHARIGWAVFPLQSRGKLPVISKAEGGNGFRDATTDLDVIRERRRKYPDANIGVAMPPGVVVLDVDGAVGIASRKKLEAEHGPLPFCARQLTPGGGEHWLMTDDDVDGLRQDVKFLPGLDTRCAGRGYIVGGPSVNAEGRRWQWLVAVEPAPLPSWLRALIAKPVVPERKPYVPPAHPLPGHMQRRERYARAVLRGVCEDIAGTGKGSKGQSGRNDALNKGWWRLQQFRDALPIDEARGLLLSAALSCGLEERETCKVLR